MLIVVLTCLAIMAVTTVIHYEVLRTLNDTLPGLLLIAWSASYTFLSMERFWSLRKGLDRA